jgi:dephospho-CoA kinase
VVHELYGTDEVRDAVIARWGRHVAPDGRVDRSAVARAAFASTEDRAWLERLLWPRVARRVAAWREEVARREPPPEEAVGETPLMFEAGMDRIYDATIAIVADEDVRRRRAAARGHAVMDERAARQLPQEEKAARATYVVENSGTVRELTSALSRILENLDDR